jgi:conjugal transfer pilus assembly protein TraD
MQNKRPQNQSPQLDLFTPIYEIFHEVCVLLFELIKELVIFGWNKYQGNRMPVQKIDQRKLAIKKHTERLDCLGIDTRSKKPLNFSEIDFKKHSFIVGASGFGKTNLITILQENSLRMDKPIIFFDPKGDLKALKTFERLCKLYKKPCFIFSEHYENSVKLNPILEGSVNQVVDRIMGAFNWSEEYYKDVSRRALTKVLLKLEKSGTPFSLKSIFDHLNLESNKDITGLISKIEAIIYSDFGKFLSHDGDGLTLSQIREQKACLYIGLSTQGYGETAVAVGKLFLGELLYNSYKTLKSFDNDQEALSNPVSIYFDEFGSLVTPQFIELQNKCRGAGMELTLAVQSPSDIDRVDPSLTKQVIENAGNLFILKQRLDEGASFFADAIGTIKSSKKTYRFEGSQQLGTGSEREVHELIVHPDIIKNLNIGQCVLLRQGPVQVNLLNIRDRKWDAIKLHNQMSGSFPQYF